MKPYKVNNTWVDLDHVLAVQDKVVYHDHDAYVAGYVTMSFLNEPLCVWFGHSWFKDEENHKKRCRMPKLFGMISRPLG